jgi:hypothetical protein
MSATHDELKLLRRDIIENG